MAGQNHAWPSRAFDEYLSFHPKKSQEQTNRRLQIDNQKTNVEQFPQPPQGKEHNCILHP
jgi:hypothetical protein